MLLISQILIVLVAVLHVYFLVLEMFLWTKPQGMKAFRMSAQKAQETKALAANQGLYNGFLAAGLVWSLIHADAMFALQLKVFFLGCVIVAAMYGAYSVSRKILIIQGVPAILAMTLVLLV